MILLKFCLIRTNFTANKFGFIERRFFNLKIQPINIDLQKHTTQYKKSNFQIMILVAGIYYIHASQHCTKGQLTGLNGVQIRTPYPIPLNSSTYLQQSSRIFDKYWLWVEWPGTQHLQSAVQRSSLHGSTLQCKTF